MTKYGSKIFLFLALVLSLIFGVFLSCHLKQKKIQPLPPLPEEITPTPTNIPFFFEEYLTKTVGRILADPLVYKDKMITVIGYYRGWDLFHDVGTGPPASRSDWVIKDASGAIYVEAGRGFPVDLRIEPKSQSCKKILQIIGKIAISSQGQPYIVPEGIKLWGETILSQDKVNIPPDCLEGSWEGFVKRCGEEDTRLYNPTFCEHNQYLFQLEDGTKKGFNYGDFKDFEKNVGSRVILIGCEAKTINITKGPLLSVREIIIKF